MNRRQFLAAAGLAATVPAAGCTAPTDGTEAFPDAETVDDVPAQAWEQAVTFTPLGDAQRREFRSTGGSGTCGTVEEANVKVAVDAEGLVHQSTACTDASS